MTQEAQPDERFGYERRARLLTSAMKLVEAGRIHKLVQLEGHQVEQLGKDIMWLLTQETKR